MAALGQLQVRPDCSADGEPCRVSAPRSPLVALVPSGSSLHGKNGLACDRHRVAGSQSMGPGIRGCAVSSQATLQGPGPGSPPLLGSVGPGLWSLSQLCFPP